MKIELFVIFRHLDISQTDKILGTYKCPNHSLKSLVSSLPNLTSLDISGTNLAGTGSYEDTQRVVKCDIPGLVSRVDCPLEFLGLYKTEHEASLRAHIPAKEISGEVTESHMLSAARRYLHRPEVLDSVLSQFYHRVRTEEFKDNKSILEIGNVQLFKFCTLDGVLIITQKIKNRILP